MKNILKTVIFSLLMIFCMSTKCEFSDYHTITLKNRSHKSVDVLFLQATASDNNIQNENYNDEMSRNAILNGRCALLLKPNDSGIINIILDDYKSNQYIYVLAIIDDTVFQHNTREEIWEQKLYEDCRILTAQEVVKAKYSFSYYGKGEFKSRY